jgi:peptidoglycan/xylan/chitin deacetylase (PgdA/CDA1 family)
MLTKTSKKYTEYFFAMCYWIYLWFTGRKTTRRVVFYYHGLKVSEVQSFEKQIAYLAANVRVVKPSEILIADCRDAANVVALTFDDAFESIREYAVPILRRYKITAAICVPAGHFSAVPPWMVLDGCSNETERVMTEQQVAALHRDGFEIFSHTLSHPVLTEIADAQLDMELSGSKKRLEQIIGQEVIAVTYPYGSYDSRVCDAAKRAGYKIAFTTEPRVIYKVSDLFKIGRFKISPDDDLMDLRLRISGAYQAVLLLRYLKHLIKKIRF